MRCRDYGHADTMTWARAVKPITMGLTAHNLRGYVGS
jgi:hypothetical protein